jgi:hypothetical protein
MSTLPISTLKGNINSRMVTGAAGSITPEHVRDLMVDMVDTVKQYSPHQGLAFSGSGGALFPVIAAFSTGDFIFTCNVKVTTLADFRAIVGGAAGSLAIAVDALGKIVISKTGTGVIWTTTNPVLVAAELAGIAYVRLSGVGYLYKNGALVQSNADATDYTAGLSCFGGDGSAGTNNPLVGSLQDVLIENRAFSASEVLDYYTSGAIPAIDFAPVGAGTQLITGVDSTFASDSGWWSKLAGSSISGGVAILGAASGIYRSGFLYPFRGYKLSFKIESAGSYAVKDGNSLNVPLSGNADAVISIPSDSYDLFITSVDGANIDNVKITPVGVAMRPDPAAQGVGLKWHDAGRGAVDTALPASGVSWLMVGSGKNPNQYQLSSPTANFLNAWTTNIGTGIFAPSGSVDGYYYYTAGTGNGGSVLRFGPGSNSSVGSFSRISAVRIDAVIRIPILADATQIFTFTFGLQDNYTTPQNAIANGSYVIIGIDGVVKLCNAAASVVTEAAASTTITANTVTRLTYTYDSGVARLYKNGVLVASLSLGFPSVIFSMGLVGGNIRRTAGTTARELYCASVPYISLDGWTP